MARYTRDLVLNKPMDFVAYMMNDYLQKNGFSMSEWKGEPAYRAGDALLEGYKYMKWYYDGYMLHVEAWMKGSFGGEMDLDGFVGALQKKPFKESLEQLFILLMQQIPAAQPGMMMQSGMQGQVVPVIPVQTVDNPTAAILALVLGIFSIVLGFIIPLFGLICAVLGVNQARLGGGSSKAGVATAGKVLSIIGLVVCAIMWMLNILIAILV
ncbi:MAG: DUF4190 domain-containing protein [Lachnospiraceae bacterium]|nr:DUF4190 domain-containing protein [Lachnospiraceae bacterium]